MTINLVRFAVLSLFFVLPGSILADVTASGSTSHTATYPASQLTLYNFTVGSCTNGLLRVATYASSSSRSTTDVSFGSQSFTQKEVSIGIDGYGRVEYWYLLNPSTGTNNIVANFSSSGSVGIAAQLYCGVDQASPFRDYGTDKIDGETSAGDTLSSASGDYADDAIGIVNYKTLTPDGSQSQLSCSYPGGGSTFCTSNLLSSGASVSMGWSWSGGAVGGYIVTDLKSSTGTPTVLNAPSLSSPSDTSSDQSLSSYLVWNDTNSSPNESFHYIRIKASGGSYSYYYASADSTSVPAATVLGAALSISTTYYWSVQAQGNGSSTSDSAWPTDYSFTTTSESAGTSCSATESGPWTITSQQAATCTPYNGDPFDVRLPVDVMDHLYSGNGTYTGDEIAQYVVNAYETQSSSHYGVMLWASPDGYSDQVNTPVYYGQSSDPIYYVNSCRSCVSEGETSPLHTYWHIPNQAQYSGLQPPGGTNWYDNSLIVWDQTNNKVLRVYASSKTTEVGSGVLPNCTATTEKEAAANCALDLSYAQITDYSDSLGYWEDFSGGLSINIGGMATFIRTDELMSGTIPHALYGVTSCFNADASPQYVFPAKNGWLAIEHDAKCPSPGSLLFLDYTDAQIAAMDIPAPQKTILKALSHYGLYIGDRTPVGEPFQITLIEAGRAYAVAEETNPIYAWLGSNGISNWGGTYPDSTIRYGLYALSGLPNLVGPNCEGSTCGVLEHVHIADECVALGLANLPGGCGIPYATPPTITITSPSSSSTYSTDSSSLSIGGTAAAVSPATISSIECVNDQGGEIVESGTTTWTGSGTYSDSDVNTITCTVTDSDSLTGQDSIAVSYYVISNVADGSVTKTTAAITWDTNLAGNSVVQYGTDTNYGLESDDSDSVTSHSITLSGLAEATTYHYRVCTAGFCSSDGDFVTESGDLTPVLSDVKISVAGFYSVTIIWTTDLASDSYVNYGLTAAYGQSEGQSESVTSHEVTITGLSYNTQYHFQCASAYEGNTGLTSDSTFSTASSGRNPRLAR